MAQLLNEYTITIDIKNSISSLQEIPCFVQGDDAVIFVKILENGLPYDYSTVDRYVVNFKRPDGTIVNGLGTYDSVTGLINYKLGFTEMEKVGNVETAISLYLGETRVTTKPFIVKIVEDYEGGIESQEGYNVLQELFIEVDSLITKLTNAPKTKSWVSTEGQLTYTFVDDTYTIGQLQVIVGGVFQMSGINFTEDSTTSFTFLCAPSEIPAGLTINAIYR
jgi:hypothetical protein